MTMQEYRMNRLREYLPERLFDPKPTRKFHLLGVLMLRPIGPRVLIKRIDAPRPTSSTIIIPDSADGEKSNFAVVLAVGTGVRENIQVADTVVLAQYSGSPVSVELDGEQLDAQFVMEADVLGVLKED